jgi:hypothetical protein
LVFRRLRAVGHTINPLVDASFRLPDTPDYGETRDTDDDHPPSSGKGVRNVWAYLEISLDGRTSGAFINVLRQ